MVRVGFPGWKLFARLGFHIRVRIAVHFDVETKTFWADSPDLDGLIVSGATLEELAHEVHLAATSLLELQLSGHHVRENAIVVTESLPAMGYCPA